jgi:small subunit ribosomal protein S17
MKKVRIGKVVSNRMDKTVVVRVETLKQHPLYKKTMRQAVKYKVHDPGNTCNVGDVVTIIETRPLSREKRWRVLETRSRKAEIEATEEKDVVE